MGFLAPKAPLLSLILNDFEYTRSGHPTNVPWTGRKTWKLDFGTWFSEYKGIHFFQSIPVDFVRVRMHFGLIGKIYSGSFRYRPTAVFFTSALSVPSNWLDFVWQHRCYIIHCIVMHLAPYITVFSEKKKIISTLDCSWFFFLVNC